MKQLLFFIGIILLISVILGSLPNKPKHICSDLTHITCDGYCVCDGMECTGVYNNCPYEGLECPNAQKYARDYQISLTQDSIYIWDGDRQISVLPLEWNNQLGAILLKDNQ